MTTRTIKPITVEIRITHSQVGMCVDARQPNRDWQCVQLTPYQERAALPGVKQYSTCIDPAKDESEYWDALKAKKLPFVFKKVQE